MKKRRQVLQMLLVVVLLASAGPLSGQMAGENDEIDWQASLVSGWFSGATILRGQTIGDEYQLKTDDGVLIGLRLSGEQEYFGGEITLAGVFQDLNLKKNPAAIMSSPSDSTMFLFSFNALIFPTGNTLCEGRVRPFLTIGPGLAIIDTDFDKVSNETIFNMNVGTGVKFLLGDEGNPVLRFDWRWYYMVGSTAGLENSMYHQELTVGLGIRF
ncbi:MAG: outer membrane beta-barrel protein [Sedimentisphaerales bacterium]|nr:outer membrane beta-barrel protein [Sedimentisphaerales bacterium]